MIEDLKYAVTKLAKLVMIPPSCLAQAVAGIVATLRIVFSWLRSLAGDKETK